MSTVGIIGCGWLGLPLGKHLVEAGYKVVGSTTRPEKLKSLEEVGIEPVLLSLNPMPEGKDFNKLFKAETLFINVPPRSRSHTPEYYREQIKYLKYQLQNSSVKRVIFISSTSFYPNTGEAVDESTPYDLQKGSTKAVVYGELEIAQIDQPLSILRCGGLMGGDRIPGKWFAGKETTGAETPINYIHRDDVIKYVAWLLEKESWPAIKNMVSSEHISRKQVHEAMATKYNFAPPVWINPQMLTSKIVESNVSAPFEFKSPLSY